MAKKDMTPEERAAFGAKMKAARAAKQAQRETIPTPDTSPAVETVSSDQDIDELKRQMQEVMETNALLKAALLNQTNQNASSTVGVNSKGLVGEVDKYLVDPANYPDPTPRLAAEHRLAPLAFNYNYELEYESQISSYQTKAGVNMREPRFHITLNRIVLNDQGEQTNKRYIARKLVFHEDPDAALAIARENGIEVDKKDEKAFLDEMRYLRVRDWLFDIFWPKPAQEQSKIHEEVIGGSVVQVFTKNSADSSEIEFDKLKSKLV